MTTTTKIDHSTFTISFERQFAAPREDVFEAWTDPLQMKEWWDPTGVPLAECTIDLRPGGAFRFVGASDHGPPFSGVYRVVQPPAHLAFDAMGAAGQVHLNTVGNATHMTVTIRCASAEHLKQFVKLGVAAGTDRTLDNLVSFIARRAEAASHTAGAAAETDPVYS